MSLLCLLIAAQSMGFLVWRRAHQARLVETAYRLMTGLCVCAVVIITAGSLGSLVLARALVCVIAAAGLVGLVVYRRRKPAEPAPDPPRPAFSWMEWLCIGVVAASLIIAAISVFAPPTDWDAVVAHLALPAQYAQLGHITVFEGNTYSGYPHLLHTLYTFAYCGAGETGAQFVSWLFAFLACVFAYAVGERLAGRLCGLLSAAIFATTPVFFDQAGVASLDVAVTAVVLGALGALLAWHDEKRLDCLLMAGFLAGSASGIRHTGYIVCVLLAVGVLVSGKPANIRAAAAFSAMAALGAAPWLLRSWLAVGNPVYPFFQDLFPSDVLVNVDFTSLGGHASRRGAALYEVVWFPWRIVMHPARFDGWNASPGGLIFALGIPGVVIGGKRVRMLGLFCLCGVVFFFFFQHYARYLLPFFAAMMPVAAFAACRLPKARWAAYTALVFTFAVGLILGLGMNHFKIPAALGTTPRETYLAQRVERYGAFQRMNELLEEGGAVFTLDPRTYYFEGPTFRNLEPLRTLIDAPLDDQLRWFARRDIRYLFYPVEYVNTTPVFTTSGLIELFKQWRNTPETFRPIEHMQVISRNGAEEVIIFEIVSP